MHDLGLERSNAFFFCGIGRYRGRGHLDKDGGDRDSWVERDKHHVQSAISVWSRTEESELYHALVRLRLKRNKSRQCG